MSESYTIGGDSYFPLSAHSATGQTFRPVETHTLEWIDLNMKLWTLISRPNVHVYRADANHEPIGDPISRNQTFRVDYDWPGKTYRVRFKMIPFTLNAGEYYVMISYAPHIQLPAPPEWQFDAGDATYPRGIRISRDHEDDPWTKHYTDDHMFVEFGTPPAITPPPEPPIINVAPVNYSWRATCTGYILTVATNVPCNLKMLWTTEMPFKHMTDRYLRGIAIQPFIKYCFVVYHTNEQEEPGDTLYHTFIKDPWPICETRYFTFRGKVDDSWSPSSFPIFKLHFDIKKTAFIDTASNRSLAKADPNWTTCHDAPIGSILPNWIPPWCLIFAGNYKTVRHWIYRGVLFLDTTLLDPSKEIAGAYLSIFVYESKMTASEAKPYLYITQGVQSDPVIPANYGHQLPITAVGGQIRFDELTEGQYINIPFNDTGLTFINPGGITKLCLRSQLDVDDFPPASGANLVYFFSHQKGPAYSPKLIICHQ